MAVAVGTRLRCERCGTEIVVVRAPASVIECCGEPMAGQEGQGS